MYFRSAWEANYARYLNLLVQEQRILQWEYEPLSFAFPHVGGIPACYTPDFRVLLPDQSVEYHEVKGFMDARSQKKLDCMSRYYPDVRIQIIGKEQYLEIAMNRGRHMDHWEGRIRKG